MTERLIKQVRPFFATLAQERPSCFPPQAKLIVGVSGGPDSLALLHLLAALYAPNELIVAHVNHQLRPSASAEAQFVQETATSWQIPCRIKAVDVAQIAAEQSLSLEEAGRWVRYQFFAEVAAQESVQVVAVAHHADDQAETVLMHFLRGTGLSGLRGMLPVAPLPGHEEHLLIRPFLHTTRADIEAYCQRHHLQPLHDESNLDTHFLRNRLRHELLPQLADYNPQIKTHLQQLAANVAADYELIEAAAWESWTAVLHSQTANMLQLKRAAWLALPLALRRRTLRQAVQQLRPSPQEIGFVTIEQARQMIERGHTGTQSSLPGDLILIMGYETLTITADSQPIPLDLPQLPAAQSFSLPIPGELYLVNDWKITASLAAQTSQQAIQKNSDLWTVYVDVGEADKLTVRGRQAGERLRPLGMKGQIKIKDLMINRKLPTHLRALWPLVVSNEQIIWVVGHHLAEQAKITSKTSQVVKLQCQRT